jgi:hypothetical protein
MSASVSRSWPDGIEYDDDMAIDEQNWSFSKAHA